MYAYLRLVLKRAAEYACMSSFTSSNAHFIADSDVKIRSCCVNMYIIQIFRSSKGHMK